MLRITKAADPIEVKQLTLCVYAPPGVGKTSLGFTAEAPLLLDFDAGSYRSQFRKDTVQLDSWSDVESITADDMVPYKTVIIDTAGRALDSLTAHIIAANPKMRGFGGALSLQGYGALKTSFIFWLKRLHGFGKDVVLLAHMDEQRSGDDIIERLDVQGGSKNEIYKAADAMARLTVKGGQRMLNFDPTEASFGKNPAGFAPLPVPSFTTSPQFLATVLSDIKAKLNEAGSAAIAEQGRVETMRADFDALEDAEAYTGAAAELAGKGASDKDKALLIASAKAKGLIYDAKAKGFIAKPAKTTQAA